MPVRHACGSSPSAPGRPQPPRRRASPAPARPDKSPSVSYGQTIWSPAGKLIGRVRLPEVCGNVCFGGLKRNRLFMAASQSLYAVYTATQGAAPG